MPTPNLFSLFGGPQNAVNDALRASSNRRMQSVANNVAAATARSGANPVAVARLRNQALMEERNSQAALEARMRAQAGLQQQEDISQLIGGGLSIGGTILGSLVGGPMGGAAGSAVGKAAGDAATGTLAGQDAARAQALGQPVPQAAAQAPAQAKAPGALSAGDPLRSGGPFRGVLGSLDQQFGAPQAAGPIGQALPQVDQLFGLLQPPLSDEESKTALADASSAIDQLLRTIQPQSFEYRNPSQPGARPGRQTGVMAQDLERSAVGRQMVQQGPDGMRRIDPQAALSTLLAAQARIGQRLDGLERDEQQRRGGMGVLRTMEANREQAARGGERAPALPLGHGGAPAQAALSRAIGPSLRSERQHIGPAGTSPVARFAADADRRAVTEMLSQQQLEAEARRRHAARGPSAPAQQQTPLARNAPSAMVQLWRRVNPFTETRR